MTGSRRCGVAALTLAAMLATASVARAEPTAAERETARQLMERARDHLDQKDLKGALEAFKAADDIMGVPTTGFQVGNTQAQLGRLIEARETLARVNRLPVQPNEPEPFKKARDAAAALYDDLGTRIPSLRIQVSGAEAEVAVDGVVVPGSIVKFPFKVNPGHHVVTATAGTATAKQEVDIREKEIKDVALQITGGGGGAVATAPPQETPKRKISPLTYVGFGVAGVGVVVGSVTGILMFSKKSDLDSGCTPDKQCPPATHDTYSSAYTMATISTVSFIVAGVGAGVGVVSLLMNKHQSTTATAGPRIEPWAGLGSGGVRGTF